MCDLYRAAILHHYSPTHGEQAARGWAGSLRGEVFGACLASGMTIVAEEMGVLLGLALFEPDSGGIEICILPDAEKRAIASALLAVIETEARTRGLDSLRLCAMLNSERLFIPSGFAVTGPGEDPVARAARLPCVRMEKPLQYAEFRPDRRRTALARMGTEVDLDGGADA
jgi:GNAT superfamily N-acetyltransferase